MKKILRKKRQVDRESRSVRSETATSWQGVVGAISRIQDTQGMVFYHRGQGRASWGLTPSLVRLFTELNLAGPASLEVELNSLNDFKRRARLWLRSELLP